MSRIAPLHANVPPAALATPASALHHGTCGLPTRAKRRLLLSEGSKEFPSFSNGEAFSQKTSIMKEGHISTSYSR